MRGLRLAATVFAVLVGLVLVLDLAGVPSPPAPAASPLETLPFNPHRLVSNNLKIGDVLRLDLTTFPQTVVWMLASSNTGPSYIGPYFVELGADWSVLHGPVLMGAAANLELLLQVPYFPGLVGLEFAVQCAVGSPFSPDVIFSNGVELRGSQGIGKNILILRQTVVMAGMTTAAQQATSLASALQLIGNVVTVADDVLPQSLLDYDCILDLRFSMTPASDEPARFVQFLRECGGVFFVSGPYAGCPGGQQRAAWLEVFLNATLGVGAQILPGGNLSNAAVETIDANLDPGFLSNPLGIAGFPFNVTSEGGSFGAPGAAPAGSAWLTGTTVFGELVFGMFFEPASMTAEGVGGRVGVLFSGGPNTFEPTAESPYPHYVMCNLAWYLDR